jgi:hypothetical protein
MIRLAAGETTALTLAPACHSPSGNYREIAPARSVDFRGGNARGTVGFVSQFAFSARV